MHSRPPVSLPSGCFALNGSVKMAELADCYALKLGAPGDLTLSEFILSRRLRAMPGDSVTAGPAEFVVMQADGRQVQVVALRFRASAPLRPAVSRRHRRRHDSRHAVPPYRWPSRRDQGDHARLPPG